MCVCVRALRIVSRDKVLRFKNTLIIKIRVCGCLCVYVCLYVLRIISPDKIVCCINYFSLLLLNKSAFS